jgi:phage repressor protein C with HTH and peptisase S24 domain
MDDVLKAIDAALKEKGLSDAAASKLAVGNPSLLKNLRNRRGKERDHPIENLKRLAKVLDLEVYIGPPREQPKETVVHLGEDDYAAVPLFAAQASAGPGAENGDAEVVDQLAFQRTWLQKMSVKPDNACLLRVRGDSMSPHLQDGDVALIDQGRTKIRNGHMYAFVDVDGQTRIKRLDLLDDRTLLLRSDNPNHTWELRKANELNRLKMIGEVVWSGHSWKA